MKKNFLKYLARHIPLILALIALGILWPEYVEEPSSIMFIGPFIFILITIQFFLWIGWLADYRTRKHLKNKR